MHKHKPLNRAQGFTLIELMITVAIISILAAIAFSSYNNYVTNSRRAAAAACLSEVSQFMERFHTTNQTYAGANPPALTCRTELARFYTFAVAAGATATTYSVTATPVNQQLARDSARCGTLGLTQAGTKSVTGSAGVRECW